MTRPDRIWASCLPETPSSARVLEKLGFRHEGRTCTSAGAGVTDAPRQQDAAIRGLVPMTVDLTQRIETLHVGRNGLCSDHEPTRVELLRDVWGYSDAVTTRTVDTHVAELRRRLETDPAEPPLILTVWKVGYRLKR